MQQRIITAIIALIVLIPLIIYGDWPFVAMTYLFAIVGLYELMRMLDAKKGVIYTLLSTVFLVIMLNFQLHIDTKIQMLVLFMVILFMLTVVTKNKFTFSHASFLFLATFYISISFFMLIEIRMLGLNYLLFILFLIWATDSGAYFVGRSMGKRKLWPEISPNKTIAGAIGGIVIAVIIAIIFQLIYPFEYSYIYIIGLAIIISVFGQIGDLAASAIKRQYGIKDYGNVFPGHGGILDRLDSLLFVLLILYVLPVF